MRPTGSMRRRDLLGVLASLAACRAPARAQQSSRIPTIGFLGQSTPSVEGQRLAAFLNRLNELGWTEGRTVAIKYAWGEGSRELFARYAADFVGLKVDVIVTSGTENVRAAMQATA